MHPRESSQSNLGTSKSHGSADERQQKRFRKQLPDKPASSRTQSRANGELTLTSRVARQEQVSEIHAGYQQDQAHRSHQPVQKRPQRPCPGVSQSLHSYTHTLIPR